MANIIKITDKQLSKLIKEGVNYYLNGGKNFDFKYSSTLVVEEFNNIVFGRKTLTESSINRIIHWLENCECAFITAWRGMLKASTTKKSNIDDEGGGTWHGSAIEYNKQHRSRLKDKKPDIGYEDGEYPFGHNYSVEENKERNRILKAKLLSKNYGVIDIKGVYPEGMEGESSEESFLVFNVNNDKNFYQNLFNLSEAFNQDSFYYKPLGEEYGFLVGTNESGSVPYGDKGKPSKFMLDVCSNYMSRFKNKPFAFASDDVKRYNSREEAMNDTSIDDYEQRIWPNEDNKTFKDRKTERKKTYEGTLIDIGPKEICLIEDYSPNGKRGISETAKLDIL